MEVAPNKIIVHALGGCGINLADKVVNHGGIDKLGKGFAEIVYNYVDTSLANISKIEPKGEFFKIDTESHSKGAITGSGGEAKTHLQDIIPSVDKYLDKINVLKPDGFEYHILMFSCSGGSGRVIGSILLDKLLQLNVPVIAILVGDNTNALYAINTANTIASLHNIANNRQKAITAVYVNNGNGDSKDKPKQDVEADINNRLAGVLTAISLFLSGVNEFLDNQDMVNMINPSNYTTIKVNPGIYGLVVYNKDDMSSLPKGAIPVLGRTLVLEDGSYNMPHSLLHHKHGYIKEDNVVNIFKKENLPVHMLLCANYLVAEEIALKELTNNYYNVMDNITVQNITGTDRSSVDNSTGLVF